MIEYMKKVTKALFCAVLVLHATACGTLMHPERKGQTQGPIDVGVAILDGIGLLFFIIPGVIAYAVDFSNGTIYLPSGKGKSAMELKDLKIVRFDPKGGKKAVEAVLLRETGTAIKLDAKGVRVYRLESKDEVIARFAGVRAFAS